MELRSLHTYGGVPIRDLLRMYPQFSRATIYRHAKRRRTPRRPIRRGRPQLLDQQPQDRICQCVTEMRQIQGTFSSPALAHRAGVSHIVSNRTVRRVLNRAGFKYLATRRKGVLTADDKEKRLKWCRTVVQRGLNQNFWRHCIAIYLDAVGFEYKRNPSASARVPSAREWRTRSEGLVVTTKGKKEGRVCENFLVGISYGAGVVLCSHFSGPMSGQKMADLIESDLPAAFERVTARRCRRILQDNCPRQTSKVAKRAFARVGAVLFQIPPRSPDFNPIENVSHLVKRTLKRQAVSQGIVSEDRVEFRERCRRTLDEFPLATINRTIDSMPRRMKLAIASNGARTKY